MAMPTKTKVWLLRVAQRHPQVMSAVLSLDCLKATPKAILKCLRSHGISKIGKGARNGYGSYTKRRRNTRRKRRK